MYTARMLIYLALLGGLCLGGCAGPAPRGGAVTVVRGPFSRAAAETSKPNRQGGAVIRSLTAAELAGVRQTIIERTNRYRRSRGLAAVRPHGALDRAADSFARYMARTDQFGHHVDGRRAADRARAAGYGPVVWENIAYVWDSAGVSAAELQGRVFDGWARSAPHAANLRAGGAREIGVGLARSGKSGRWYAVMLLGKRSGGR